MTDERRERDDPDTTGSSDDATSADPSADRSGWGTLGRLRSSRLVGESGWGVAIEVATLFGTVLSFTLLGRSLGAAGYGGYASLYAIVGPLVTLAASGIVLAILQHVVRERESVSDTARSCLSLSIGLGLILTVIGSAVAGWVVDGLTWIAIVSILLTEFVAAPLVQVAASTVQAATGFAESAKIRLQFLLARIVVLVVLFASDRLTVAALGVTMLVVAFVLGVWSLAAVGRRYGFTFLPGPVRLRHFRTNVLHSVAISAAALNADGDKLVLAANKLVVDTGLYAAAYRVVSFGLIPVSALVQATHARFLEHEEGVAGQHLRRSIQYGRVGALYGLFAGAAMFLAAPLLTVLMGDEFEGSITMVRWLAPVLFMRAAGIFAINGLMGLNRLTLRTGIIVANALFSLALYIVLIPRLGWEGAAIGTLISEALTAGSSWVALVVCQRRDDRRLRQLPSDAASGIGVEAARRGRSDVPDA